MSKAKLMLDINRTLRRFKHDDLRETVLSAFPEITWKAIAKILLKENLSRESSDIAKVLCASIADLNVTDLKTRLGVLKLLEISHRTSQRNWDCYKMKGKTGNDVKLNNAETLADLIRLSSLTENIQVIHKVICHENIHWIMIIEKKTFKRKPMVLQQPRFFAISFCDPYIFSAQRQSSLVILQMIGKSLGYERVKKSSLVGHHVSDLLLILRKRDQRHVEADILNKITYQPAELMMEGNNLISVENENRQRYAESLFGPTPPKLESLTLIASDCSWADPRMEGEPLDLQVTFVAPNVCEYLSSLVEHGVLETPLPDYFDILNSGKNTVMLRMPKTNM